MKSAEPNAYKIIQSNNFSSLDAFSDRTSFFDLFKFTFPFESKGSGMKSITLIVLLVLLFVGLTIQGLGEQSHSVVPLGLHHNQSSYSQHLSNTSELHNHTSNLESDKTSKNYNMRSKIQMKLEKRIGLDNNSKNNRNNIINAKRKNKLTKLADIENFKHGKTTSVQKNLNNEYEKAIRSKNKASIPKNQFDGGKYIDTITNNDMNYASNKNGIKNRVQNNYIIDQNSHRTNTNLKNDELGYYETARKNMNNVKKLKDNFDIKTNRRFKRNIEKLATNNNSHNSNRDDDEDEDGSGGEEGSCCGYKEVVKQSRIEGIKSDILNQLRLSKPPNVPAIDQPFVQTIMGSNDDISTLRTLTYAFDEATSDGDPMSLKADDDLAATNRAFFFCEDLPQASYQDGFKHFYCFFQLSEILKSHDIKNATMGIFLKRSNLSGLPHPSHKSTSRLHAESVLIESVNVDHTLSRLDKRLVEWSTNEMWLEVNIVQQIIEWQKNPRNNQALKVSIEIPAYLNHTTPSFSFVSPKTTSEPQHRPYLDLFLVERVDSQVDTRMKRSTVGIENGFEDDLCDEYSENTSCCRFPLLVNFTEFEWNFILQPTHYQAYYCAGYCGTGAGQSSVYSHLVEQTIRSYSSDPNANGLCCAPRSFAPLKIVYLDENHTALSEVISSMVVQRCGCF